MSAARRSALAAGILVLFSCVALPVCADTLTFEQRVAAQEAIERTRYPHLLDAHRSFESALPRKRIEAHVRDYLRRSTALELFWQRPVSGAALRAELLRIETRTQDPERLRELYEALENDRFLLQECLARPTLVRRLTLSFFARDQRIHAAARMQAEQLQRDLAAGIHDANAKHLLRYEREIEARELEGVVVGEIEERLRSYTFNVLLSETEEFTRIATYTIPKIDWDEWWSEAGPRFDSESVMAVAAGSEQLTAEAQRSVPQECIAGPDDIWDAGVLGDFAERSDHTIVWTGTEMIVWGGRGSTQVFDTGARYDPLLDTWTPVATVNAPTPRYSHSAVWTGSEMIVFGGTETGLNLRTGGRYNPVSDTWVALADADFADRRRSHSAVWTGNEMIVWGGSLAPANSGLSYDSATDSWTPLATMNEPASRWNHTAVWTGNAMIIWGGEDDFDEMNSGAFYRPLLDRWSTLPTTGTPSPRAQHTAVWTGSEMVVWGGKTSITDTLNTGARVDPFGSAWLPTTQAGAPDPRALHAAVWTGTEMIVWGGREEIGGRYDPFVDSWTSISTTNQPELASAGIRNGSVWTGTEMIAWESRAGGRYDPATDSWVPVATSGPIEARMNHTTVWTGNEMIVWGGAFGTTNHPGFDNGARYDPVLDHWSAMSTTGTPERRESHTAVWTGNEMVVWGGRSAGTGIRGTGGRYDPMSDTWTPVSLVNASEPRTNHTAVWSGSEMILWGGGLSSAGARYSPQTDTWSSMATSQAPSPRAQHTAIWSGQEMIVWGGSDGGTGGFGDGARYDPLSDTWISLSPNDAPTARRSHTAVWTGSEMVVWGGGVNSGAVDGSMVGAYDPGNDSWSLTATVNAPVGRDHHTGVWTGSEMVVWGGKNSTSTGPAGGLYDPTTQSWRPVTESDAPAARYRHGAVWTGDRMIVWGGNTGFTGTLYSGSRYAVSLDSDADGIEDSCDCAPTDPLAFSSPPGITGVRWLSDTTTLEWESAAAEAGAGTTYDVMRGETTEFPPGSGASEICVEAGTSSTSTSDFGAPPVGTGRYYLVRAANSCGIGSYGSNSSGNPRTVSVCP